MRKLTLLYVTRSTKSIMVHLFDILIIGSKGLDAVHANKATSTLCWLSKRRTARLQRANTSNNKGRLQGLCKGDDLECQ